MLLLVRANLALAGQLMLAWRECALPCAELDCQCYPSLAICGFNQGGEPSLRVAGVLTYHPTAIHYRINSPNPQT
eukprot:717849-Amphidinium_carterae.1